VDIILLIMPRVTAFRITCFLAFLVIIYFAATEYETTESPVEILNTPTAESNPPAKVFLNPEYRIFGLGDCHGDLPNTVRILRMAGIIDEMNNWIAGNAILVQTGDIVVSLFLCVNCRIEGQIRLYYTSCLKL
jgi:hypothetical protein